MLRCHRYRRTANSMSLGVPKHACLGANVGASRANNFLWQANGSGQADYDRPSPRTDPDDAERLTGIYGSVSGRSSKEALRNLLLGLWTSRFGDRKVVFKLPPRYTQQDVVLIKDLMEAGSYQPVIDRVYPLEDVADAARYVETQQKIGNVVLAAGRESRSSGGSGSAWAALPPAAPSLCVIHSLCSPVAVDRPRRERAKPRANVDRLQATPSDARRLSSLVKCPLSATEPRLATPGT
ncbi:MAG: zinc-binding dehydrogenase [Streptosporangiaceae bacterium]